MGQRGWRSPPLVCPALCGTWRKSEASDVVAELWDGRTCQGIPDQAPHFPAGSRRGREEERRGVRCGADIAVASVLGGIPGEALQAFWRGCAACWHSLGVTLCPALRTWPCGAALVWAENTLRARPASEVSRDIRCPFLSFLFRAVPLCFPLPCHKHGLAAGSEPCEALEEPGRLRASPRHGTGSSRSSLGTAL